MGWNVGWVYVWRPNFGGPEIHPLSPFKDPVALQWALDDAGNQVLYVAGKKDRMLAVYDASRFELLSRVELTFEPTTVEPLGGGAYLLAPRPADGEPFWAFTNHGELKVHFVPAPPIAVWVPSPRLMTSAPELPLKVSPLPMPATIPKVTFAPALNV